jgi:outer membrane protein assembly factor BamB
MRSKLALALLLASATLAVAQTPKGHDWPRLLGPRGDGHSQETGLDLDWSGQGPPLVWSDEVGLGFAPPVVAGGRVFVFDRVDDEARLRAFDAASGERLWDARYPTDYVDYYQYSPGPRAAPVVAGERVCAHGVEGRLRCHRTGDGELLWELDTSERFHVVKNFFGVGSAPIVHGELLIVPVGGSPPDSPKIHSGDVRGDGSGLVAFDVASGEVRWQASDELASYSSPVIAEVGEREHGLAFLRGGLVGFDPASGAVAFEFPWRSKTLDSVNAANPVVVGSRVLIAETYGPGGVLLDVGGDAPEVVWRDPRRQREQSLRPHWMTPIVVDGVVYASSGRNSGDAELRAVVLETGRVLWSEPDLGRTTLIHADGHLIALTEFGRLLAIEPSRERLRIVADATPQLPEGGGPLLESPAWAPPALAHGRLYLRGKTRIACFDLRPAAPGEDAKGR